ncbi:MAG: SpaA isopeptide-forming pilin-related protein, partial [Anaerostipes sp.]|nr:SpaA isopeptide-forming pilin-related protein [Anaerostipes sp.]
SHTVDFGKEGLHYGETYIMEETTAPEGYKKAESITFSIDEKGDVTSDNLKDGKIVMTDEYAKRDVNISKTDINGTKEIAGAQMVIVQETEDGKELTLDSWTSEADKTHTSKLIAGTYTLIEMTSPAGYVIAESIQFTVGMDGKITVKNETVDKVIMKDDTTKVQISKVAITGGKELPGAKLQLIDKDGNVVESWTSTTTKHEIYGKLVAGETYTLREITAPNGYEIANDITFTVKTDGTVQTVEMVDEKLPDESHNGGDDENSGGSSSGDDESSNGGSSKKHSSASSSNTTKTGDNMPILWTSIIGSLALAGAGIIVFRRKKK